MTTHVDESSMVSQLDLYEDLLTNENAIEKCQTVQEVTNEKEKLREQNKLLVAQLNIVTDKLQSLTDKHNVLLANFSSLLQTAKCELERKNKLIAQFTQDRQNSATNCSEKENRRVKEHVNYSSRRKSEISPSNCHGKGVFRSTKPIRTDRTNKRRQIEDRVEVKSKISRISHEKNISNKDTQNDHIKQLDFKILPIEYKRSETQEGSWTVLDSSGPCLKAAARLPRFSESQTTQQTENTIETASENKTCPHIQSEPMEKDTKSQKINTGSVTPKQHSVQAVTKEPDIKAPISKIDDINKATSNIIKVNKKATAATSMATRSLRKSFEGENLRSTGTTNRGRVIKTSTDVKTVCGVKNKHNENNKNIETLVQPKELRSSFGVKKKTQSSKKASSNPKITPKTKELSCNELARTKNTIPVPSVVPVCISTANCTSHKQCSTESIHKSPSKVSVIPSSNKPLCTPLGARMSRNCNIDQTDSNETLKIKNSLQPHAPTSNRLSNIKLPKHKTSKNSEKTILKQVANFKPKRKNLVINKSMEQVTKVSPKQPERQELQVNNLALNNSNEKKCAILAVTSHSQENSFEPNKTCGTKSKVLTKVTEVANNRHENKENSSLYDQDAPNTLGTLGNTDVSSKHSLGFMYGYRNASLHCLLHLATKLLSSCKSDNKQEKQTVGKSRDLWVLSLDNCQKRRRQNNQWLSERNKQNGVEVEDKNINLPTKSSQQIPVDTLPSLSTCSTSFLLNEESMRAFFSMEHAVTPIKTPWNSYADRMDS